MPLLRRLVLDLEQWASTDAETPAAGTTISGLQDFGFPSTLAISILEATTWPMDHRRPVAEGAFGTAVAAAAVTFVANTATEFQRPEVQEDGRSGPVAAAVTAWRRYQP